MGWCEWGPSVPIFTLSLTHALFTAVAFKSLYVLLLLKVEQLNIMVTETWQSSNRAGHELDTLSQRSGFEPTLDLWDHL